MSVNVTASSDTLMRQAGATADLYLGEAIDHIDRRFGSGYAAKHPELVGAFINTCALDFGAAVIARAIEETIPHDFTFELRQVASGLHAIANAMGDARKPHGRVRAIPKRIAMPSTGG